MTSCDSVHEVAVRRVPPWAAVRLLGSVPPDGVIAADVETTGLDPRKSEITAIGFYAGGPEAWVVLSDGSGFGPLREVLRRRRMVWHNGRFDARFIRLHCGVRVGPRQDTMLLAYALNPHLRSYSLESLAVNFLKARPWKEAYRGVWQRDHTDPDGKPCQKAQPTLEDSLCGEDEALARYLSLDVLRTWQLWKVLQGEASGRDGDRAARLYRLLMRLDEMLVEVELNGIGIDQRAVTAWERDLIHRLEATEDVDEFARSPKKCLGYIRSRWGSSLADTSAATLRALSRGTGEAAEFAGRVLQRRILLRRLSAYVPLLRSAGDRLYPNFVLHHTVSGRITSSPNVQNLPQDARKAIVPAGGYVLAEIDARQHELHTLAWLSGDEDLARVLREEDLHASSARMVYGRVTPELRSRAKTANFAMLYSGGVGILIRQGFDEVEAHRLFDSWASRFPKASGWLRERAAHGHRGGISYPSPFGRIRRLEPGHRGTKESRNHEVQSAASDVAMLAASVLVRAGYRVVNLVHDSMLLEIPAADGREGALDAAELATRAAREVSGYEGFEFEAKIGQNWGDMQAVEKEGG